MLLPDGLFMHIQRSLRAQFRDSEAPFAPLPAARIRASNPLVFTVVVTKHAKIIAFLVRITPTFLDIAAMLVNL